MSRLYRPVALVLAGLLFSTPVLSQDKWAVAARRATRLAPSEFPYLPDRVAEQLVDRGCAIPQVYEMSPPHNVVSGDLLWASETSWAVLCSVDLSSSVLLFAGDDLQLVQEIRRVPDRDSVQGYGHDTVGYSRLISFIGRDAILEHNRHEDWPIERASIFHGGLVDGNEGKDGSILYFTGSEWVSIPQE